MSGGEQTYTVQALADLIEAGVRIVQPDIIKEGGITGMMQCAALCYAHGVELVPHQTQPTIGHSANLHVLATLLHATKPAELADGWARMACAFKNPPKPADGQFEVPSGPGLGLEPDDAEFARRRRPL